MRGDETRLMKLVEEGDVAAHVALIRLKLRRGELFVPEPAAQSIRRCCRCNAELTDAASREAGIGPVCRNRTNAAFARAISADVEQARQAYGRFMQHLQECPAPAQVAICEVGEALFEDGALTCKDWRKVVLRTEWVLSFGLPKDAREALYEMTEALGYMVLVSMWRGEIVKGGAGLFFKDGELVLRGPMPNRAIKDQIWAIEGSRGPTRIPLPAEDGKPARFATEWRFPAFSHRGVRQVMRHFLIVEGVEEALSKAAEIPEEAAREEYRKNRLSRYMRPRPDGSVDVVTPYNAHFVNAMRALPDGARQWTGSAWRVSASHVDQARALVTTHYIGGV